MKVIRFRTEGIFNSFRVPFFRTYHKSFLAPPKTTIIGMLTNIAGKPEKWYYDILSSEAIQVSVVINNIKGKAKDLWAYKTYVNKSGMHGRSVIRRDRLFHASYWIYLKINNEELKSTVLGALYNPQNIPSLGLDDEIIKLYGVEEIDVAINHSGKINSVFMDLGLKYSALPLDYDDIIELPTGNIVPLKFKSDLNQKGKREWRIPQEEYKQIEYLNCEIEIEGIESYSDGLNRVVFY